MPTSDDFYCEDEMLGDMQCDRQCAMCRDSSIRTRASLPSRRAQPSPFTVEIASAFREYDRRLKWKYNEDKCRFEIAVYGLDDSEKRRLTELLNAFVRERKAATGVAVLDPFKRKAATGKGYPKPLTTSKNSRQLIFDND